MSDISPKQELAIIHLLAQPTLSAAATAAGVNERTLYRWLQDPAFDAAYRATRRDAVRQAIAVLQRSAGDAAAALASIAGDPTEKGSSRVSAARAILELAIKAVEIEDLDARLAAVEAALKGQTDDAT